MLRIDCGQFVESRLGCVVRRVVALTSRGRDLIAPAFRKHAGQMRKVFSELSSEELRSLEVALKKIGKRAAVLMEQRG